VFRACLEQLPAIEDRHADIRRRIAKAARVGFKVDNLRRSESCLPALAEEAA
jgi:hypothetical protein